MEKNKFTYKQIKIFLLNKYKCKVTNPIFNLKTIYNGHYNVTYRGIPMLKNPFDYVLYQMLINDIKPDLIIEIGSYNGASALYYSDILDLIGNGMVHSIDIEDHVHLLAKQKSNIKFFTTGYQNYDLNNAKEFNKIMVIDDGSHYYEDVLKALNKFSVLININSYYIVEDGVVSALGMKNKFNGGPLKAIDEFLKNNKNFIIDRKYCYFFGKNATFNVNGFLKRIK